MTRAKTNQNITTENLKAILPFATMLVALALAWGSLTSQVSLLGQRTASIEDRVAKIDDKQQAMNDKLVELITTISDAKSRGLLGSYIAPKPIPTPSPKSMVLPDFSSGPGNESMQNVYVSKPSQDVTPTPSPNPSPIKEIIQRIPIVGAIL